MAAKKRRGKDDPMRRALQGVLTLVLTTLAGVLAAKITDMILGKAAPDEENAA